MMEAKCHCTHIQKIFLRAAKDQLPATRNRNINLKTYNQTTITHWNICEVKTEHNNKNCTFFVVSGNGHI